MSQPEHVDVPVYLVIEPRWKRYGKDEKDRPILESGKVVKSTQSRPTVGPEGGVVTKITLRIAAEAFLPLQPEAVIHIDPGNAEVVEVTADSPEASDLG